MAPPRRVLVAVLFPSLERGRSLSKRVGERLFLWDALCPRVRLRNKVCVAPESLHLRGISRGEKCSRDICLFGLPVSVGPPDFPPRCCCFSRRFPRGRCSPVVGFPPVLRASLSDENWGHCRFHSVARSLAPKICAAPGDFVFELLWSNPKSCPAQLVPRGAFPSPFFVAPKIAPFSFEETPFSCVLLFS